MVFNLCPLIFAVALVACGQGPVRVDVSGSSGDLHFKTVAAAAGEPACADQVSVMPVLPEDAESMWQIITVDRAKCNVTVRYGESTADFAESVPATPLRQGVAYRVRISGAGFSAVRDFRLTAKGIEVQD